MGNREVEARYREANREQINARKRKWHANNRERVNKMKRERYPEARATLLGRQRIKCACLICAKIICRGHLQRHIASALCAQRIHSEPEDKTLLVECAESVST